MADSLGMFFFNIINNLSYLNKDLDHCGTKAITYLEKNNQAKFQRISHPIPEFLYHKSWVHGFNIIQDMFNPNK